MPWNEFTIVVDSEVTYETDGSVSIGKKDAEYCIRGEFLTELLKIADGNTKRLLNTLFES